MKIKMSFKCSKKELKEMMQMVKDFAVMEKLANKNHHNRNFRNNNDFKNNNK